MRWRRQDVVAMRANRQSRSVRPERTYPIVTGLNVDFLGRRRKRRIAERTNTYCNETWLPAGFPEHRRPAFRTKMELDLEAIVRRSAPTVEVAGDFDIEPREECGNAVRGTCSLLASCTVAKRHQARLSGTRHLQLTARTAGLSLHCSLIVPSGQSLRQLM